MKKLVMLLGTTVLLITLAVSPLSAKKAGIIANDTYTDDEFGFSFATPNGWSIEVKNAKSLIRVAMTQKSYPSPKHFQGGGEDYTQIPTITVFADTTTLTVENFVKSLFDPEVKSEQKKFFMQKLAIISKPHDILKSKDVNIAGVTGKIIEAKQRYTTEVAEKGTADDPERGTDKSKIVTNHKGGAILFVVKGDKVYVIHLICEFEFYGQNSDLFNSILGSLKLN